MGVLCTVCLCLFVLVFWLCAFVGMCRCVGMRDHKQIRSEAEEEMERKRVRGGERKIEREGVKERTCAPSNDPAESCQAA